MLKNTMKVNAFTSSNEYGVETYTLGSTTYPCRFDPQEGAKVVTAQGEDAIVDGFVYCASTVPINEKDRIQMSSVDYRILSAKKQAQYGSDHHWKLAVRRV